MDKKTARLNRKHNQIQHDIKRIGLALTNLKSEVDRLSEDIDEYAQNREKGGKR